MVMVLLQNGLLAVSQENGDRKVLDYKEEEEGHAGRGEEQVQVLSRSCTRSLIPMCRKPSSPHLIKFLDEAIQLSRVHLRKISLI